MKAGAVRGETVARRCGGCGKITPEYEFRAFRFTPPPCTRPGCRDPKRAYAEELDATEWPEIDLSDVEPGGHR